MPFLHDSPVSTSDAPDTKDIASIIAALYNVTEQMGINYKNTCKFRLRKQFGLMLLQDVLVGRPLAE
jgi:hypothetical protein